MTWPRFNNYMVLLAGVYLMSASGTIYLVPTYAQQLRKILGYNQEQIGLIAFLANAGTWAGVVGGLVYDKFGPKPTAVLSSTLVFLGYFLIYLASGGYISTSPSAVGFFAFIMGQGSGWGYTVALNTNVLNFLPKDRGTVVGVLVCFFGLCSGIYTQFYKSFFLNNVREFLLFMAIACSSVILIFGGIVSNVAPQQEKLNRKKVAWCYALGVLIAVYLAVENVTTSFFPANPLFLGIPLIFMLAWFVYILIGTSIIVRSPEDENEPDDDIEVARMLDEGQSPILPERETVSLNLIQAAMHPEFWIIFISFLLSIGSGIVTVDSIPVLVLSREPGLEGKLVSPSEFPNINTFVVLFSVFNTFGRMAFGVLSDYFMHRMYRATWLIVANVIMFIVQVYLIFATPNMLFFGMPLLGVAYGATFCVLPTLASEVFGVANFGANWGILGTAPAVGSYFFGSLLAGRLLDHYTKEHHIYVGTSWDNAQEQCYGEICFKNIYFSLCGATGLAIILACFLRYRLRNGGFLEVNPNVLNLFKSNEDKIL